MKNRIVFLLAIFASAGMASTSAQAPSDVWAIPAGVKPDKRLRDMPVENQVVTFD